MLTNSFISTDRRVEMYLEEDNSNTSWGGYRGRCNANRLEYGDRFTTDLGVDEGRFIIYIFLDEDEFSLNRLEDINSFSSEENSFL